MIYHLFPLPLSAQQATSLRFPHWQMCKRMWWSISTCWVAPRWSTRSTTRCGLRPTSIALWVDYAISHMALDSSSHSTGLCKCGPRVSCDRFRRFNLFYQENVIHNALCSKLHLHFQDLANYKIQRRTVEIKCNVLPLYVSDWMCESVCLQQMEPLSEWASCVCLGVV